ncbi:hypothetical protein C1646_664132 [Rhizophagus diaphanus]|nr:hypothetical protein C1646_664132 [Rhizophagus diaphanus] [Rhizophagus sp. MUCL 43196]
MPAKISTITYVHDSTERLTQDYMVKEIIAASRTDDNDVTNVIYRLLFYMTEIYQHKLTILRRHILKRKFVGCSGWYSIDGRQEVSLVCVYIYRRTESISSDTPEHVEDHLYQEVIEKRDKNSFIHAHNSDATPHGHYYKRDADAEAFWDFPSNIHDVRSTLQYK